MPENKVEIIKNERLGESYIHKKHKSGLDIYVWEMEGFTMTNALFGTKYGSVNTRFKTNKDSDFADVPAGIAHFLEHKLFENEDCDVFELYAKTGADGNAYTSFEQTVYLFNCSENYTESLKILLDFVQKPYFTKATVDKEQGIIGQEIKMCEDSPSRQCFFKLLEGMFVNHPVKIDIAGTVESIAQIDADLLYRCYNTFYNLNNMVLCVAGNCKAEEVFKICDECLRQAEDIGLQTEFQSEPDSVAQKYISRKMQVSKPLFSIGFKAKPESGIKMLRKELCSMFLLELLYGKTSPFYKNLTESGLLNVNSSIETFNGNGFFTSILSGESEDPKKVCELAVEEIDKAKKNGLDQKRFEQLKKATYGMFIRGFNSVESCASNMLSAHFTGTTVFDYSNELAKISLDDVKSTIDDILNPENMTLAVIEPIE